MPPKKRKREALDHMDIQKRHFIGGQALGAYPPASIVANGKQMMDEFDAYLAKIDWIQTYSFQLEQGADGKKDPDRRDEKGVYLHGYHIQFAISVIHTSKKSKRQIQQLFTSFEKLMVNAHVEWADSIGAVHNYAYKLDTRVVGPYRKKVMGPDGKLVEVKPDLKQHKTLDLKAFREDAKTHIAAGKPIEDLEDLHDTITCRYPKYFERIVRRFHVPVQRTIRTELYVLYGPPSTGKDTWARNNALAEYKELPYKGTYPVKSRIWRWNKFKSCRQSVLFSAWDPEEGNILPLTTLEEMAEMHQFEVQDDQMEWHDFLCKRMYIVSNYPPHTWYPVAKAEILRSRITKVIRFDYKDGFVPSEHPLISRDAIARDHSEHKEISTVEAFAPCSYFVSSLLFRLYEWRRPTAIARSARANPRTRHMDWAPGPRVCRCQEVQPTAVSAATGLSRVFSQRLTARTLRRWQNTTITTTTGA